MESLWQVYNSEDSWLPFFVPLIYWIGTYAYCGLPSKSPRPEWNKWAIVHEIHNNSAVVMGWISLYFNDDSIFNERVGILWSLSYFLVDGLDAVYRLDAAYTVHATLCLVLGVANYTTPMCRELRMNARAAQCELSTPILYLARKTKEPLHFVLFAIVFTMCRIVFIPAYLILPVRNYGFEWTHWIMMGLFVFYGLNCFWYSKIIRMIIRGKPDKTGERAEKKIHVD
mmetsp:Transcript_23057/g.38112  ORF Transcript_23057/g.38112 Transcript_23057/m.38112 type:complete len:227 (+) Transcript_23057:105-785(+)